MPGPHIAISKEVTDKGRPASQAELRQAMDEHVNCNRILYFWGYGSGTHCPGPRFSDTQNEAS